MDELTTFVTALLDGIEGIAGPRHGAIISDLMLSMVAASRRILARHKRVDYDGRTWCDHCTSPGAENEDLVPWPCADVLDLAAIRSDRPDYRQEWKP
jgi:hypothetical protein